MSNIIIYGSHYGTTKQYAEELSRRTNINFTHKTMMKLIYNAVKNLPQDKQSAENRAMIETYNKKVDFIDFSSLDDIINEITK